jgi:iron complex outermembrane receptor protein
MTYRLGVVPLLFNAGVATISGGEVELQYAPTADFRLDASVGRLNSGFDSITPPSPFGTGAPTATATLASRLPFTPDWQAHVGASYTFHLGNGWTVTPRADVSYTGSQFFDAGNSVEVAQNDSVTLLNAAVTFESPDSKWRAVVSGNNLTDKTYPVAGTSSLTTSSGYAEIIYARPRNFAATLSRSF